MKLKSYFNPNRGAKLQQVVEIRTAADAAPAAPFVLLGDLIHENLDNASGMQRIPLNHAIFQHVQEQLYLKYGIQDMQRIKITNGGSFKLIDRIFVDTGINRVGIGHTNTITVKFDPSDATHDPVQFMASNPALIEIVANEGDGVLTFKNKGKGELFIKVRTTGYEQDFPFEFTEELPAFVEEEPEGE